tara:strand:- start:4951 stop:8859 length:3909 start_codon:yes stop_codon:yes gene_type:complete
MSKPAFDPSKPYEDLPDRGGYHVRKQGDFEYKKLKDDFSIEPKKTDTNDVELYSGGTNPILQPFGGDMTQAILNYEEPNQPDLFDFGGALAIEAGYNMAGRTGGMALGLLAGPAAPVAVPVLGFIGNGVGAFYGSLKAQEHLGLEVSYGRAFLDTIISYNPFGTLAKGARYANKYGKNLTTKTAQNLTSQKIISKNFENQVNTFAQASETLVNKALSNQHIVRVGGNIGIGGTYGSFRELGEGETRMGAIFQDGLYSGALGELFKGAGKLSGKSIEKVKGLTIREFDEAIKRGEKHPTIIKNILDGNLAAADNKFTETLTKGIISMKTQFSDQFEYIRLLSKEGGGNDYFRKDGILKSTGDFDKPYQAFRLIRPLQERKKSILNREVNLLNDAAKQFSYKNSVSTDDFKNHVSDLLYAKHMLDINNVARKSKGKSLGSGKSDDELKNVIKNIESMPEYSDIKKVADGVKGVSDQILDQAVSTGMISKRGADSLRKKFPNYVPLFKDVKVDDIPNTTRPVYPLSKKPAKALMPRVTADPNSKLKSVFDNVRDANIDMIMKSEKNVALQALGKSMTISNVSSTLGTVKPLKKFDAKGNKKPIDADGIPYKENGKDMVIKVKDPLLLDTIRGMSIEKGVKMFSFGEAMVNVFATLNKFQGAQLTGLSPDFQLANLFRDRGESFFQAMAKMDTKQAASLLNPKVLGEDIFGIIRGRMPNKKMTAIDAEYKLFQDSGGGNVSGLLSSSLTDLKKSFDDMNFDTNKIGGNFNKNARAIFNGVSVINDVFEQSSRFATFRAARKSGMTAKEAALAARDSSFDPLLRGSKSNVISALYMFGNPALQSTKNFIRRMDLSQPQNRKATATMMTGWLSLNTMQNQWNNTIIGEDWREQYKDTLPDSYADYTLNNHIIFANPFIKEGETKRKYVKLPVPYSQVPMKIIADGVSRLAFDENYRSSGEVSLLFGKTFDSVFDNMSPIPRGFMPTVMHNALGTMGIYVDENQFGQKIQTWNPPFRPGGGEYTNKELKKIAKAKDMVPVGFDDNMYGRFLIKATDYINTVLKEDDVTMMTPETLKFGLESYFPLLTKTTPQVANDFNDLFNAIKYGKTETLDATKMTGLRRFFGDLPVSKASEILEVKANSAALDAEFFNARNDNARDYKFLTKEYSKLQNDPNAGENEAMLFNQKFLEMTKGRPDLEERVIEYTKVFKLGIDTFTERSFMNLSKAEKAQRYVEHIKVLKDPAKIGKFFEVMSELGGGPDIDNNKMWNQDIEKYMRIKMDLEKSPFFKDMSSSQRQETIKQAFDRVNY